MKRFLILFAIFTLILTLAACQNGEAPCLEPEIIKNWTIENETQFLKLCGENDFTSCFEKSEFGNYTSYHSKTRTIEGVPVEGDGFGFTFEDGELIDSYFQWREDLPDELPSIIGKEDAIRIVAGDANTTAELRYIEPINGTWDISPTNNPCWIVRIWKWYEDINEKTGETVGSFLNTNVTVVDAVHGTTIGYGTPYP